ncbi:hypothetical protein CEXT_527761 [Caerostris extrusa]|uniref:Uncharacterized protein n=1 Tax=Caerostris extrusa TaxID=172846 RepID=A0AAV4XR88_CAEEX|nr:hypothetical protein CEXT_527761 [Caerostris extrusa]
MITNVLPEVSRDDRHKVHESLPPTYSAYVLIGAVSILPECASEYMKLCSLREGNGAEGIRKPPYRKQNSLE